MAAKAQEVTIILKTIQTQAEDVEEYDLETTGELFQKGATLYLRYEEEIEGHSIKTTFKIKDEMLLLTRREHSLSSSLDLRPGQITTTRYQTQYGALYLEVNCLTYTFKRVDEKNGQLKATYELSNGQEILGKYKLRLQFKA